MSDDRLQRLLADLRGQAGDRDARAVLGDALLERADPRGEVLAAQLAGRALTEDRRQRCLAAVLQAAPQLERVRVEAGLVTRLDASLEALAQVDGAWLAGEPLVIVRFDLPGEAGELPAALAGAEATLRRCRGFELSSRVDGERWPTIHGLIADLSPQVLGLDLSFDLDGLGAAPSWPFVEIAALQAEPPVLEHLLRASVPGLRRLKLRGAELDACVRAALALPELEHLDLRGCSLTAKTHAALDAWRGQGRSIRHERFDLAAPDLDDPFGERGWFWEAAPALRGRGTAVPGEVLSFACARGDEVQLHLRDNPHWQRRADAAVTALAAVPGALLLGREDGVVERWSIGEDLRAEVVRLPGSIRTIRPFADELAVVHAGGWWSSRGEQGDDALVDLWLGEGGSVRAIDSRVIVRAGQGERVVELGEPVRALCVGGPTPVVIAGADVWRLDEDGPTHLGSRGGGRPALAGADGLLAWTSSRTTAAILDRGVRRFVTYPNSYSHTTEDELAVADVCVLDEQTVVAVLEHGGANLLLPTQAMKADEFPGEPHRRWIFFYAGSILVAD